MLKRKKVQIGNRIRVSSQEVQDKWEGSPIFNEWKNIKSSEASIGRFPYFLALGVDLFTYEGVKFTPSTEWRRRNRRRKAIKDYLSILLNFNLKNKNRRQKGNNRNFRIWIRRQKKTKSKFLTTLTIFIRRGYFIIVNTSILKCSLYKCLLPISVHNIFYKVLTMHDSYLKIENSNTYLKWMKNKMYCIVFHIDRS